MALVTVYNYKKYDISTDEIINDGKYATLEYIALIQAIPVIEDKLELNDSLLDAEGRYMPKEAK